MESTEELGYLGWNLHHSHLHAAVSIGLPLMDSTLQPSTDMLCFCWAAPGWSPQRRLLPWMESTEEQGYLRGNSHCSHLYVAVSIGLSPIRAHWGDGLPWLESRLKPRLLPQMGWGSAEYVVTVHFTIICSHFIKLYNLVFISMYYNPISFPFKFLSPKYMRKPSF
jgi:hypothetical protein